MNALPASVGTTPVAGALRLALLGPPVVEREGRWVAFRTRKALALVADLAAARGPQPRDLLAALLWPESTQEAARTMLRSALAAARRALGEAAGAAEGGRLIAVGDTLALDLAGADLDLAALRRAARAATVGPPPTGRDRDDPAARMQLIDTLQAGLEAYRGDFLAGFSLPDAPEFEAWAGAQREDWHRRLGVALARLVPLLSGGGENGPMVAMARRWVAHDPLDEAAHRALMRACASAGDRPAALAAFDRCRAILDDELGIAPAPETVALAARLRRVTLPAPQASPAHPIPAGPGSTATPMPPMIGRGAAFDTLLGRYAAAGGAAQVVVVEGERGIGKTRLVDEFLAWAATEGAAIARGRAHEIGGPRPYAPLVAALRAALASADAPAQRADDLRPILDGLPDRGRDPVPAGPWAVDGGQASDPRLFEAVVRAGAALRGRTEEAATPLVIFVDDFHWADGGTLDLLAYALRRWTADRTPILVLLARRPEETGEALARWLRSVAWELPVGAIELGPLGASTIAELAVALGLDHAPGQQQRVGEPAAGAFGRWLHDETGGQPLYLAETIAELVARGVAVAQPVGNRYPLRLIAPGPPAFDAWEMPARVRAALRARLAPLGAEAAALLTAAAVLGNGATFTHLARVAGLDEDAALAALDEALERRLLREGQFAPGGAPVGEYAFTNDRVRDVVYADAGAARRQIFHRRALQVLGKEGAPAELLAPHALAIGMMPAASDHQALDQLLSRSIRVVGPAAHDAQDWLSGPGSGTPPHHLFPAPGALKRHGAAHTVSAN